MGFTPQVVDLDGDGARDVLSGSVTGELYVFRGLGRGRYAAGRVLRDARGQVIEAGSASTVFAHDWNGDGRLDLLVGCADGSVLLYPQERTGGRHGFGPAVKISAAGKAIQVPGGDAHAVAADWDGDGRPDLVVGAGDGSVLWYPNAGSRAAPRLEPGRALLPPVLPDSGNSLEGPASARPRRGIQVKVCVTDWNGDGQLDLLSGDFSTARVPPPYLPPAQRQALEARLAAARKRLEPYQQAVRALGRSPAGLEARLHWSREHAALRARYKEPLEALQAARTEQGKYGETTRLDGFVWVALGCGRRGPGP